MPRSKNRAERKVDSLLFVLANKPWTIWALIGGLGLVFLAGLLLG